MIPISALPFALPANAWLLFEKFTGAYTVDEYTGNEVPTTEKAVVRASLTLVDKGTKTEYTPGRDLEIYQLKGYLIDPKQLSDDYVLLGQIKLFLTDMVTGQTRIGELMIEPVTSPYYTDLISNFGTPISGSFKQLSLTTDTITEAYILGL